MTPPSSVLTLNNIRQAPKALLHDHLDGGLRPGTVLDIASQIGYDELPAYYGLAGAFMTQRMWSFGHPLFAELKHAACEAMLGYATRH